MRDHGGAEQASQEQRPDGQQPGECGDSLPFVPHENSLGGGLSLAEEGEAMRGMRDGVRVSPQHEQDLFDCVSGGAVEQECEGEQAERAWVEGEMGMNCAFDPKPDAPRFRLRSGLASD